MKKVIILLLLIFLMVPLVFYHHEAEDRYATAINLYHQGIKEEDTFIKSRFFNQALEELLTMHEGSVSKNVLLGEILSHLGQYPMSVYYYLQALQLEPENKGIEAKLKRVIHAGKLPTKIPSFPSFPSFEQEQLKFAILFATWVAILLWAILKGKKMIEKGSYIFAIPLSAYGIYIAISIFFAPILGLMIHSQGLYQEAGFDKPTLGPIPLPAGTVVTVLRANQEGNWLKIRTNEGSKEEAKEGVMGYVPQDAIRLLR